MNPSDSDPSSSPSPTGPAVPVLATQTWHRFVTAICLLTCAGIVVMGFARLFDPTEGRAGAARPMDYVRGLFFILIGIQGCRFLIRQLRARASPSARSDQAPNDRNS